MNSTFPTGDGRLTRYTLNLDTGEGKQYDYPVLWSPGPAEGVGVEWPFINPAFKGLPYCYVYLQAAYVVQNQAAGLLKVDMCRESSVGWYEKNKFPSEPIFVARPGGTEEDDGVIVSPVFDSGKNSSSLHVWDAKDLSVLAVLDSPVLVPYTFHGIWIDSVGF